MKSKKIVLFSLCIISPFLTTNAQIWKKLKEKVENKVEQKIEAKIDKKTDEIIDDALDGNKKNNEIAALPDKLEFVSSLEIELNNASNTSNMTLYLSKDPSYYGMSTPEAIEDGSLTQFTLFSKNSITIFINTPGLKIKQSVFQNQFTGTDYSEKMPSKEKIIKTGATKNILGYLCYEYSYSDENVSFKAWTSKEFPVQKTSIAMLGISQDGPIEGFILELNITSDGESSTIKATKFNKNNSMIIQTAEYKKL
jgi:hypothetical protein